MFLDQQVEPICLSKFHFTFFLLICVISYFSSALPTFSDPSWEDSTACLQAEMGLDRQCCNPPFSLLYVPPCLPPCTPCAPMCPLPLHIPEPRTFQLNSLQFSPLLFHLKWDTLTCQKVWERSLDQAFLPFDNLYLRLIPHKVIRSSVKTLYMPQHDVPRVARFY